MRDQYAGDLSDVLKFGLLRALIGTDRTLGIAWYYVPGNDGRADGRHLEWRGEPAWRRVDAQLHTNLSPLKERSVAALERLAIWPKGMLFHREPMPTRPWRSAWVERMCAALEKSDIVFLDPDNGLGKETAKHATVREVGLLRRPGRALVFITFPGRNAPHDLLLKRLHDRLRVEVDTEAVLTMRTNVSVPSAKRLGSYVQRQRWFTIVDPDPMLVARARAFADALPSVPRVRARLDCTI